MFSEPFIGIHELINSITIKPVQMNNVGIVLENWETHFILKTTIIIIIATI